MNEACATVCSGHLGGVMRGYRAYIKELIIFSYKAFNVPDVYSLSFLMLFIFALFFNRKRALNVLTPWLAPIIWNGTFNITVLDAQHKDTRIGLSVFGVKKYIRFLLPFLESAERYFMVGHKVTYYVFTDKVNDVVKPKIAEGRTLQLHDVAADKRWQDVVMRRMEILTAFAKERMPKEIDYLVCAD
ncbi:hypothetical protein GDO81_027027, partial [Engystomops pustulosus]